MSRSSVSVVVPALDEARTIGATLSRLREPEVAEVLVVDGGSRDDTVSIARSLADRVLETPRSRSRQLNAGAGAARGDVFFFLHADTLAPPGFGAAVVGALASESVIGGSFDVELDDPRLVYRAIAAGINARARWTGHFTGDQGIFLRRDMFERLGGFPDLPICEDLAMSHAMKKAGPLARLSLRLRTSARRWRQRGPIRTVLLMWSIRALYFRGVSPERLAALYRNVR